MGFDARAWSILIVGARASGEHGAWGIPSELGGPGEKSGRALLWAEFPMDGEVVLPAGRGERGRGRGPGKTKLLPAWRALSRRGCGSEAAPRCVVGVFLSQPRPGALLVERAERQGSKE